jgi:mannose-1-phosphate guanylyltransferase
MAPRYGHIAFSGPVGFPTDAGNELFPIAAFREKPDAQAARAMMREWQCLWNCGIYLFTAGAFLRQLSCHAPEAHQLCLEAVSRASRVQNCILLNAGSFAACPRGSVDRVLMEKAQGNAVVRADGMGWKDIGTWPDFLSLCIGR